MNCIPTSLLVKVPDQESEIFVPGIHVHPAGFLVPILVVLLRTEIVLLESVLYSTLVMFFLFFFLCVCVFFSVLCFFSYISGLCAVVSVPQELREDTAHTEVEDSVKYSAS